MSRLQYVNLDLEVKRSTPMSRNSNECSYIQIAEISALSCRSVIGPHVLILVVNRDKCEHASSRLAAPSCAILF